MVIDVWKDTFDVLRKICDDLVAVSSRRYETNALECKDRYVVILLAVCASAEIHVRVLT